MTIRELYEKIGGNFDHAVQIMKSDRLIAKYVGKLLQSGVGEKLEAAGEAMDAAALFESAHAMKGVCANLGLDGLAKAADEITEEFRPGSARRLSDAQVREKLNAIAQMYRTAMDGIREFQENG